MNELSEVSLRWEEEDDVVEGDGADEVEEEPGSQVMLGDLLGIQDDLVGEVICDDTYTTDE